MTKVTIIILEPSYIIRKGISAIIESIDSSLVQISFDEINMLPELIEEEVPELIIVNANLVYKNLSKTEQIHHSYPSIKWLGILSNHKNQGSFQFDEFIDYSESKDDIINKLKGILFSLSELDDSKNTEESLSEREKKVLELVARGLINKEIADRLFISAHTVITHRKNITRKLGIKSVSGLTVYAILNKLINISDIK